MAYLISYVASHGTESHKIRYDDRYAFNAYLSWCLDINEHDVSGVITLSHISTDIVLSVLSTYTGAPLCTSYPT